MTSEDCKHIAQCCHSLQGLVTRAEPLTETEFDHFIDRLIWAIHASPGGTPGFDHQLFVDRCKGKANLS